MSHSTQCSKNKLANTPAAVSQSNQSPETVKKVVLCKTKTETKTNVAGFPFDVLPMELIEPT
jgi:hypothetical protein